MKVLSNLDLQKNQLISVRLQNAASAPSNPVEGQIYYDTTEKVVKQYNGTAWTGMGGSYTRQTASADTLGGIKVGSNLTINANGVLSADQGTIVFETTYNASTNKAATMSDVTAAVQGIGTVFTIKGTKATYAEIEAVVDPAEGDVWCCSADSSEYFYTSSNTWEKFGVTTDLSGYLQKSELADNVTGESTTTAPTQKAVHDAIAAIAGGDEIHVATGTIQTSGSFATITLSGVTTPEIISVRTFVTESGSKVDVMCDISYNATTKVVTITATGHTSDVACEVFYKEA